MEGDEIYLQEQKFIGAKDYILIKRLSFLVLMFSSQKNCVETSLFSRNPYLNRNWKHWARFIYYKNLPFDKFSNSLNLTIDTFVFVYNLPYCKNQKSHLLQHKRTFSPTQRLYIIYIIILKSCPIIVLM